MGAFASRNSMISSRCSFCQWIGNGVFPFLCGLTDLDIVMEVKYMSERAKEDGRDAPSRSCYVSDFGTMARDEYVDRAYLVRLYDLDQPVMFAGPVSQERSGWTAMRFCHRLSRVSVRMSGVTHLALSQNSQQLLGWQSQSEKAISGTNVASDEQEILRRIFVVHSFTWPTLALIRRHLWYPPFKS